MAINKTTKVLFLLNNNFSLDNRVLREATALVNGGYEVNLIAVKSSLPDYQEVNGIKIHRLISPALPNYCVFKGYSLQLIWKLFTRFRSVDIIHAHDANTLFVGYVLSRLTGAKLVYDSHEYWESIFREQEERFQLESERGQISRWTYRKRVKYLKEFEQFERWVLPRCDGVISVCESLCRFLQERANNQIKRCMVLRNAYESSNVNKQKLFHETFGLNPETKVILYQGLIAEVRGISFFLEALEKVTDLDVVLCLMGTGNPHYFPKLVEQITQSPTLRNRVFFRESVSAQELMRWTSAADLGICPVLNWNITRYYCLPNKLFEYIQAEVPMAVSDFPEMAHLVNTYNIGFTFDPENVDEIAQALRRYFTDPAAQTTYQRNLLEAKKEVNWENESHRLLNLYRELDHPKTDAPRPPYYVQDSTLPAPLAADEQVKQEVGAK